MCMFFRKVTYRLYPNTAQAERLEEMLGLYQRLYNTALDERIRAYRDTGANLTYSAQCRALTDWRKRSPGLCGLNAQSEQVILKRLDLAFRNYFRRTKNGTKAGFPRFKSPQRFSGWGYKTHGDGWALCPGAAGRHGKLYLQGVGMIALRGHARDAGLSKTCDIFYKSGCWYASVTLELEKVARTCGTRIGAFDWGLANLLTIAAPDGIETIKNPRHLRNQLAELRHISRIVSRKMVARATTQQTSRRLDRAKDHLKRLHAKIARQRADFLHKTSNNLVKEFGALATEALNVSGLIRKGGVWKKGLNREILSAAPAALLQMTRRKAEEAGAWYGEAPTRDLKPTQRCNACWKLPNEKKTLSERQHRCPHCGTVCGRDENAALVLLRWLKATLSGQELSEAWSEIRPPTAAALALKRKAIT